MDVASMIKEFAGTYLSFLSVEPYPKNYVLWISGFLLLVAIAGGGLIKINDKQIGNLGVNSRIVSGVFSVIFLFVYFLVPSPNLSISGLFSDATFGHDSDDRYEIRLTPESLVKRTNIGDEGIFRFDEEHKVTEGIYYITIIKNGSDVVFNQEYTADHRNKHILVIKEGDGYKVEKKSPFEYFVNEYKFENKDWMIRYRDLRHLIDMAKQEKTIRDELLNKIASTDLKEHTMAAFVLGELGIEKAKAPLFEIINDDEKKYTVWDKLRAASQLWNYPGNVPDDNVSFKVFSYNYLTGYLVKDKVVINDRDLTGAVHSTVARLLAERNYSNACVIESLIQGVKNTDNELSMEYSRILADLTKVRNNSDYRQWTSWWHANKNNYKACA